MKNKYGLMGHGRESFDKVYFKRFFDKYSKKEFRKYVNWADGWIRFLERYVDLKNPEGKSVFE